LDQTKIHNAWNPGLESDIPPAWRELETIHRTENVFTRLADVLEISKFTGLPPEELVTFRPERLALHELIVQVNAGLVIPEGNTEEELGNNFRLMAGTILKQYIEPHLTEVIETYDQLNRDVFELVGETLSKLQDTPGGNKKIEPPSLWSRLLGKRQRKLVSTETQADREFRQITEFKQKGLATDNSLHEALYKSLYRVIGRILNFRGYVGTDNELLTTLVSRHVCNRYGSRVIGKLIAPWVQQAIEIEGYTVLPDSDKAFLISLKGASAAGKSSLRAILPSLIEEKNLDRNTFGTISPDIWRKFLLDYESLDSAYKYFGRMTSQEVIIVDGKLDRYIRAKARRNKAIPNLLVDRFRFDSFTSENIPRILYDTYARYTDVMYMYFVVTPPEETVVRGWERGLQRGRFKSVEDFLDHSLEASIGMPKVLFRWLSHKEFNYHFEFLDNSVPKGTYPKTIAKGTGEKMTIFHPVGLINLERYQKINIRAKTADEVYPDGPELDVENNLKFLTQCIKQIPNIDFAIEDSGIVYLECHNGAFSIVDQELYLSCCEDSQTNQLFTEINVKPNLNQAIIA
jgi:hypothetical protein